MKILYNKKFLKDLAALPKLDRTKIEAFSFNDITTVDLFKDIVGVEKLSGFKNYYKIRMGNYRIGLSYFNETLTFEHVLHRKEIYRYFP